MLNTDNSGSASTGLRPEVERLDTLARSHSFMLATSLSETNTDRICETLLTGHIVQGQS